MFETTPNLRIEDTDVGSGQQADTIRETSVDPDVAQALIDPYPREKLPNDQQLERLWLVIDYGWLSDAKRMSNQQPANLASHPSEWSIFDDFSRHNGSESLGTERREGSSLFAPADFGTRDWWSSLADFGSPMF
jgi:hypothetical protein